MRVRFRVVVYSGEKKLSREDLDGPPDQLRRGIRYITEFKYLEATKWLMLSEDCMEKYLLLGLLNLALGQEGQGRDFLLEALRHSRLTDLTFWVEKPERGLRIPIEKPEASLPDFLLSL